jgi:hypothetical protein
VSERTAADKEADRIATIDNGDRLSFVFAPAISDEKFERARAKREISLGLVFSFFGAGQRRRRRVSYDGATRRVVCGGRVSIVTSIAMGFFMKMSRILLTLVFSFSLDQRCARQARLRQRGYWLEPERPDVR